MHFYIFCGIIKKNNFLNIIIMANNKETIESQQEQKTSVFTVQDSKKYIDAYMDESLIWNLNYFQTKQNFFDDVCRFFRVKWDTKVLGLFKSAANNQEILDLINTMVNAKNISIQDMLQKTQVKLTQDYTLDSNQSSQLKKTLLTKDLGLLHTLLVSEKKRNSFLVSEKILTQEQLDEKLWGISKKNEQILNDIFQWNQHALDRVAQDKDLQLAILSVYNLNSTVYFHEIKYILDQFQYEGKKALIQYFLPVMSLSNLKKAGLITQNEIQREIDYVVNNQGQNLTQEEKTKIASSIDDTLIFVDTKTLAFWNIDISDEIYSSISDEINEAKQQVEKVDILWFADFKAFIKKSDKISSQIKEQVGLYFSQGNYMTISSKDKAGKVLNFYFHIKNITTTWVELTNITKINWVSATDEGQTNFHTFQELFHIFEKTSAEMSKDLTITSKADFHNDQNLQKVPENHGVQTLSDLQQALDEIDPKWFSPKDIKQMAFSFEKTKDSVSPFDEEFFTVEDAWEDAMGVFIKLNSWEKFQGPSLVAFLHQFEERKCTRFEKLDTVDRFLEKMWDINEEFKELKHHHGSISRKDNKDHHWDGIRLFVWKDQEKDGSIQIEKIEDGRVSFNLWTYKEASKKWEPNIFKTDKTAQNWSYTDFFMLIKSRKLTPKEEEVHHEHEDHEHGEHMHQHRSLFTAWLWMYSIAEISKWLHQLVHTVEHSLETGNKVKAANAALAFWRFLPLHLRVELQSEVENKEKETMEKIKKELTWVDSKVMFPMILHILENASAPSYEIEAAMFATLKYGSLYPKDLAKYRGSYIWFERLWGHKSMIPELTEYALKDDPKLVVTEEILINSLLAKQANGDLKPKRRSKIHKEFWATIQEWLNKENGDGERETGLRMTVDWRINYIMWEFSGSTYANGIGWIENVWAKWPDPAWKMNALPFIIMASWLSLELHQSLINKLKKYGKTTPYNSLRLCASEEWVQRYNSYVEKVIELRFWKDSSMYKDFQTTKKASKDKKWKLINRASLAKDFWYKYGPQLYPVINMNDGFVVSQKEKEWNEDLRYYYNEVNGLLNSSDFDPKNEDIWNEFYSAKNSPFAQTWALLYKIQPKDRWYLDGVSKEVLNSHMDYIHGVLENPILKEEEKKKIFKESYEKLERFLYTEKMDAYRPAWLAPLSWGRYNWFNVYNEMQKKWFTFFDKRVQETDTKMEKDAFRSDYDAFLDWEFEKLKKWNFKNDEVFVEKKLVQHTIDDILVWAAANDNQMKKTA